MADLLFRELSEKEDIVVGGKDYETEISKELSISADSTVLPADEGTGRWIVSTKTRRLAPAFTLSRKDLGVQELAASKKRGTCHIRKSILETVTKLSHLLFLRRHRAGNKCTASNSPMSIILRYLLQRCY